MSDKTTDPEESNAELSSRHLRYGWWSQLAFLTLGIVLETMHGLKVGWYLNVGNDVRRLLWTLAHAHGVLLAVLNIAFGLMLRSLPELRTHWLASPGLLGASLLLPGGFWLGGFWIHGGDPGLGIVLVPIGGAMLFVAVLLIALGVSRGT